MSEALCCEHLPSYQDVATPFHRIVAAGIYDGLTSGIAECRTCRSVYRFEMVDMVEDWDKQKAADAGFQEILEQAMPAEFAVAWRPWGDRILAARRLAAEDITEVRTVEWEDDPNRLRDWIAFLGLVRKPDPAHSSDAQSY